MSQLELSKNRGNLSESHPINQGNQTHTDSTDFVGINDDDGNDVDVNINDVNVVVYDDDDDDDDDDNDDVDEDDAVDDDTVYWYKYTGMDQTSLDTSSGTLFVSHSLLREDVHVTSDGITYHCSA